MRAEVAIHPASLAVETKCEGNTANSPTNSGFDAILSKNIENLKGTSNTRAELALMQLITTLFANDFVNEKMNLDEIPEAALPYCTSAVITDWLTERSLNNDFINTALRQLTLQFNENGELEPSNVGKIMYILSSYLPSADNNIAEKSQKKIADLIESYVVFPDKDAEITENVKNTVQLPNPERNITRVINDLNLKEAYILNGKNHERSEGGEIRLLSKNGSAIKPKQMVEKSSIFNIYTENDRDVVELFSSDFARTFTPAIAEIPQKMSEEFATIADQASFKQNINRSNAEVFDQIVERVIVALKSKNEQISVKLKPEYLGQVFIRVTTGKTGMKAELFIENIRLSEAMKNCIPELKTQIQQQGHNLTEVSVHTLSDGNQMNFLNHQFNDDNDYRFKRQVSFPRVSQKNSEEITDQYYFGWQDDSSINFMV